MKTVVEVVDTALADGWITRHGIGKMCDCSWQNRSKARLWEELCKVELVEIIKNMCDASSIVAHFGAGFLTPTDTRV